MRGYICDVCGKTTPLVYNDPDEPARRPEDWIMIDQGSTVGVDAEPPLFCGILCLSAWAKARVPNALKEETR